MGIKEKVKKGLLDAAEAGNLVSPGSHTYGWLERRINRKSPVKQDEPTSKRRKYRSRKVGS